MFKFKKWISRNENIRFLRVLRPFTQTGGEQDVLRLQDSSLSVPENRKWSPSGNRK